MSKGVGAKVVQSSRWGLTLLTSVLLAMPACSSGTEAELDDDPGGVLVGEGGSGGGGSSGGVVGGAGGPAVGMGDAGDLGQGGVGVDAGVAGGAGGTTPGAGGQGQAGSGVDAGTVVDAMGGMGGGVVADAGMQPAMGGAGGSAPVAIVTPLAPSEDFLFSSDFSSKKASDVPPWKLIAFQHPGVKVRGFTRSETTEATGSGAGQFDFQSQTDVAAATLADAVDQQRFAAVSFEPASPGLAINLNGATLSFAINRAASVGAGDVAVLTSIGGFAADKAVYVGSPGASAPNPVDLYTFTLPSSGYDNITGPVEIRFYALGTAGTKAPTAIRAFWVGGQVVNQAINKTPKRRDIGTNLAEVRDYGTDSPFLDKFKLARPWFTSKVNDAIKQYESNFYNQIPKDANGWPTKVPFTVPGFDDARYVHTMVRLPYNGKWAVMYKGRGTIKLLGGPLNQTITATGGEGRTDILINKSDIGYGTVPELNFIAPFTLYVEIRESVQTDPIKDIRIVHLGNLSRYEAEVFEPAFLARLHGFSPIRFLKWSNTNHNHDKEWSDRTVPNAYTQAEDDVAWEYVIKLMNATKSDGWITLPHLATDEYLTQVATMFKDSLDPNLKLYVELSNETWHNGYPSGQWVTQEAPKSGMSREEFAVRQQVRVWEFFQDVFGSQFEQRIRRPLGGWATNNTVNRARLEAMKKLSVNPRGITAQGLAVAPYFGKIYNKDALNAGVPSVERLLDEAEADLESKRTRSFAALKKAGADFGVELWASEGGQTIRPDGAAARDVSPFISNMIQANRSPRMADLYRSYMSVLDEANFSLMLHFTFVEPSSKFGAWGSLENLDQSAVQAPKHRVLEEAIFGP